jgi:hypothetical protein
MRPLRCVGIIDDKQPCSIRLFANNFSAEPSRGDFGFRSCLRLDHPASVQHPEAQVRCEKRARFEGHPTSGCDEPLVRFSNAVAAHELLALNNQNGAGLIECSQRLNIAEI